MVMKGLVLKLDKSFLLESKAFLINIKTSTYQQRVEKQQNMHKTI